MSKLIFNPTANDEDYELVGSETTNLINLNSAKYKWAKDLTDQMLERFWIPKKISLVDDKKQLSLLTKDEHKAFKGILSYLIFLDSTQVGNLPNLRAEITAPEVIGCLTVQELTEYIHSESYQHILTSIISNPVEIDSYYYYWRKDKVLLNRIAYIAGLYQNYIDNPTEENFQIALIANFLLESLYFYVGFIYFYVLASRGLLIGVSSIIRLIQTDESIHVVIFANMINELKKTNKWLLSDDTVKELFAKAIDFEIQWSNHIIGDKILGMSSQANEKYIRYLADKRLKQIGYSPLSNITENPYRVLEGMAGDASSSADEGLRENFFESSNTSYIRAEAVKGWDDF